MIARGGDGRSAATSGTTRLAAVSTTAPEAMAARFRAARAGREEAVLEGFHALKHALRFGADVRLVAAADPEALERLATALAPDLAGAFRSRAQLVDRALLAQLTPRTPATHVVAIARRPAVDAAAVLAGTAGPVVLLEDPRHLGNVGAVVRVAAAAGAAGVVTTGARDPWDAAALRGSAGLHFALPVARLGEEDGEAAAGPRRATPAVAPLAPLPAGRPLVALDPGGEPLARGDRLPARALLAFGSERDGLSIELLARAHARVALPMRPGVSSLNLATAVAAVLFGPAARA
jgi:RNA methyltransferase, TrmH family